MITITCHQKLLITILITLYFFINYSDCDYIKHISWLQSRLRVIKIILEILLFYFFIELIIMPYYKNP